MRRNTALLAVAALALAGCSSSDEGKPAKATATVTVAETPELSAEVSDECRTWIKAELLDSTDEIDATPGYNACGDLSDEELQAAIDEVTAELSAEITPQP